MFTPGKRIILRRGIILLKFGIVKVEKLLKWFKKNKADCVCKIQSDGTKVLIASLDNSAMVLDAKSGKLVFTLMGSSEYVVYADFSPDGKK
jgi:WD40 repeat protein